AFSPDGNTLASGGGFEDGTVRLWDVRAGELRQILTLASPVGVHLLAKSVAFSPDGRAVAVGFTNATDKHMLPGDVVLWDIDTGQQLYQYRDFASHGASLAFTPDGTILAFRGPRQQVQLFEASTGREHKALRREGGS